MMSIRIRFMLEATKHFIKPHAVCQPLDDCDVQTYGMPHLNRFARKKHILVLGRVASMISRLCRSSTTINGVCFVWSERIRDAIDSNSIE